jgi:hypothetical protein
MEAKQVTTAASSLLFAEIDSSVASNVTYTRENWLDILSCIALDK